MVVIRAQINYNKTIPLLGGPLIMRVYNFAPGPSMLSIEVMERAQAEFLDCAGTGMSVIEMSHRSKEYEIIVIQTMDLLRELMNIPGNYKILFIQGGATMQFSAVPMNLKQKGQADYVDSGNFAHLALKEARKFIDVHVVASSREDQYASVPELTPQSFNPQADYFHFTTNNTIYGTRFPFVPNPGSVPLVADMSSNILSQPYDVSQFALIYAGVQKNLACAGMAVVIIREDLLERCSDRLPILIDYRTYAKTNSLYNTPPSYALYLSKLTLEWIKSLGGVPAIYERNQRKAQLIYDFLDQSQAFTPLAKKSSRSLMNITFTLPSEILNDRFVKEAAQSGLVNLKGHRVAGGMRASIYNAMPWEGVQALVGFMSEFESKL
jgi:phosphoserine aminotransferase